MVCSAGFLEKAVTLTFSLGGWLKKSISRGLPPGALVAKALALMLFDSRPNPVAKLLGGGFDPKRFISKLEGLETGGGGGTYFLGWSAKKSMEGCCWGGG